MFPGKTFAFVNFEAAPAARGREGGARRRARARGERARKPLVVRFQKDLPAALAAAAPPARAPPPAAAHGPPVRSLSAGAILVGRSASAAGADAAPLQAPPAPPTHLDVLAALGGGGGGDDGSEAAVNLSNRLNPNNMHFDRDLAARCGGRGAGGSKALSSLRGGRHAAAPGGGLAQIHAGRAPRPAPRAHDTPPPRRYKRMSKAEKEAQWAQDRWLQQLQLGAGGGDAPALAPPALAGGGGGGGSGHAAAALAALYGLDAAQAQLSGLALPPPQEQRPPGDADAALAALQHAAFGGFLAPQLHAGAAGLGHGAGGTFGGGAHSYLGGGLPPHAALGLGAPSPAAAAAAAAAALTGGGGCGGGSSLSLGSNLSLGSLAGTSLSAPSLSPQPPAWHSALGSLMAAHAPATSSRSAPLNAFNGAAPALQMMQSTHHSALLAAAGNSAWAGGAPAAPQFGAGLGAPFGDTRPPSAPGASWPPGGGGEGGGVLPASFLQDLLSLANMSGAGAWPSY